MKKYDHLGDWGWNASCQCYDAAVSEGYVTDEHLAFPGDKELHNQCTEYVTSTKQGELDKKCICYCHFKKKCRKK
jgi:hypothetical protein